MATPTKPKPSSKPEDAKRKASRFPVARELGRVYGTWVRHSMWEFPKRIVGSLLGKPALEGPLNIDRLRDHVGMELLALFDDLGPIYGKLGQMTLSRLSSPWQKAAKSLYLDRLYGQWPALPFSDVADILDREIPRWRGELEVEPFPIGVASIAQVHAATDTAGRSWVVKIVKPKARVRLMQTVDALAQIHTALQPLAVTQTGRRTLRELSDLLVGFRRELDLLQERETILRLRKKLGGKRQSVLRIPDLHEDFASKSVIVLERFEGTSLAKVVSGEANLSAALRKKLARQVLSELLVQVFEVGLFHADPHAGNLILLEDGSIGLFDWGLAGELGEGDRKHIAAMLRAVIAMDLDRLVVALQALAVDGGVTVADDDIRRELKKVAAMLNPGKSVPGNHPKRSPKKPNLYELIEACLKAADRLRIPIPDGLLMMAKSLVTIEGLARGMDPRIMIARVATPVLFRAAKPGLNDFLALGGRLPALAKRWFAKTES